MPFDRIVRATVLANLP